MCTFNCTQTTRGRARNRSCLVESVFLEQHGQWSKLSSSKCSSFVYLCSKSVKGTGTPRG